MTTRRGLVDPRVGIVRSVDRTKLHPHLPQALCHVVAAIADTTRFSPWPSDPVAAGCTWWDEAAAGDAALGEAVERYSSGLLPTGLRRASYTELAAAGVPALDPAHLALFSPDQHQSPGFPFVPLAPELPVLWSEGRNLSTGDRVLVPASLVYPSYFRGTPTKDEPLTNPIMYAGVAAGRDPGSAARAALLEVVERDSVTLGWISGTRLPRIEVPQRFAPMLCGPAGHLETRLYLFPNELGLPVVGALVRDVETGVLALGTACRPDALQAALKAFAEAAQLHMAAYELDDPSSALMRRVARTPGGPLKAWRADRRYHRCYRRDWRDVCDLACQLQLYLDPAMREPLDDRLAGGPKVELAEVADTGSCAASLESYLARFRRIGLEAIAVDVTTSDVRRLGWQVTRVIVPGAYSNTPAAFPLLGGRRLADRLAETGAEPCWLPLPYA